MVGKNTDPYLYTRSDAPSPKNSSREVGKHHGKALRRGIHPSDRSQTIYIKDNYYNSSGREVVMLLRVVIADD